MRVRTTLDLDDGLVDDLVRESGKKSKKAAIEEAGRRNLAALNLRDEGNESQD